MKKRLGLFLLMVLTLCTQNLYSTENKKQEESKELEEKADKELQDVIAYVKISIKKILEKTEIQFGKMQLKKLMQAILSLFLVI